MRLISNNWYSIILNGKSYDFFNSSIGLKQGDPLFPTLFIIAAEVLSRGLNKLNEDADFKGYGLPKWSRQINHLSYANDTILFCSSHKQSMGKMMAVLRDYEYALGQMVNLSKNYLYLHDKTPSAVAKRIKRVTGLTQGKFSFTNLGYPVFYGFRKIIYFEDLLRKVTKRIMSWQNRLLSFGGRYILIRHVLQVILIYALSVINPPKSVVEQLHKLFAKFFWEGATKTKGKHWVAWDKLCYPKMERVLDFTSLHDISTALLAKLWWNFRSATNLFWGAFMWNKYCMK